MKIIFQIKELNVEEVLKSFSSKNNNSGAVISFLGKVRPFGDKKKSNLAVHHALLLDLLTDVHPPDFRRQQ